MATMYVVEPGAVVHKEYRRLVVEKDDEILLKVPLCRVSEVVLVGRGTGVTTATMWLLLQEGVGLTLISRAGRLVGRLQPPMPKNIPLRQAQYARGQDAAFCLEVARAVVTGKLKNYRTLARRWGRTSPPAPLHAVERGDSPTTAQEAAPDLEAAVQTINQSIAGLAEAADLATVRGLEGAATRAYFGVLRQALHPGWEFEKRTRRPPKDRVNALLSLGYTLLTQNMVTALEIVGLDPYEGFFHADKYGKPALALDLVEEFRGVFVDRLVVALINKRMVAAGDFRRGGAAEGVYLNQRGWRTFVREYTRWLNREITHPYYDRRLSYQKCFEVQARLLRQTIEGKLAAYPPFRFKR